MTAPRSLGSSLAWSYAMDGGRQAITSLITLVLAAMLGPEVFGLVAMALVYILFIELLLKQGLGAAVIQRRDLERAHLDSAFWLVMGMAGLLTIAGASLAGWWAGINRTPELQIVILALTPIIPLQGLTVVQEAFLRRRFRFRSLALRTNLSALLGGAVGVVLAVSGYGVWALVAQQLCTALVAVIVLWWVTDWKPRPSVSAAAVRDLIGFSTGAFVGSLGVFVNNRSDALLIGVLFGPVVVGLYRLATRLMEVVIGVTVQALMSVSLPELSRVQNDPERFRHSTLRLIRISAVLGLPLLGVLVGASEAVLRVVGEEWLPAANGLRLLCIAGAVRAVFASTGPMLQALGRPHLQAVIAWLAGLSSAAGFVVAGLLVQSLPVESQLTGLALSQALLYGGVLAALCTALVVRHAGVSLRDLWMTAAPALGAAALAALVGAVLWHGLGAGTLPAWEAFGVVAVSAGLAGFLLMWTTDRTFRSDLVVAGRAARVLTHAKRRPFPDAVGDNTTKQYSDQ